MTIEELRDLYHDGRIPKKARSELKIDFMAKFGYATPQQYNMMLAVNSVHIPTPNEFDWLSDKVQRYHEYYVGGKQEGRQLKLVAVAAG